MCTGPFELKQWKPGAEVDVVANRHYWDPALRPLGIGDPVRGHLRHGRADRGAAHGRDRRHLPRPTPRISPSC